MTEGLRPEPVVRRQVDLEHLQAAANIVNDSICVVCGELIGAARPSMLPPFRWLAREGWVEVAAELTRLRLCFDCLHRVLLCSKCYNYADDSVAYPLVVLPVKGRVLPGKTYYLLIVSRLPALGLDDSALPYDLARRIRKAMGLERSHHGYLCQECLVTVRIEVKEAPGPGLLPPDLGLEQYDTWLLDSGTVSRLGILANTEADA